MKHLTTYNQFNEGKITQFILKTVLNVAGSISIICQKIKRTHIPFKFKDKKFEAKMEKNIIEILDGIFTNAIKMWLSKSFYDKLYKTSFSEYLKTEENIDVYTLSDEVIKGLTPENIILSSDEKIKENQIEKLNTTIEGFKKIVAIVKMFDDNILEEQKLDQQFKELGELMKELDPRNPKIFNRDKEETLGHFDKALKHVNSMNAPKELDDILDKVSKFGMDSLTKKEKEDLDNWSKEID